MKGGDDRRMADFKVGKITHYYDKIGVAVVDLIGDLAVGDKIRIVKDENEFEQEVVSMQVEHEQIKTAKKGDTIGLKMDKPTNEGAEVYKVS